MSPDEYHATQKQLRAEADALRIAYAKQQSEVNARMIQVAREFTGLSEGDEFEILVDMRRGDAAYSEWTGPFKVYSFGTDWSQVVITYLFKRKDGSWSEQRRSLRVHAEAKVRRI